MQFGPDISPLAAHAVPFTLVLFRLAGLFVMMPVLAGVTFPARYKALFALMLAAAAYPMLAPRLPAPAATDLFGLIPLVFGEALIGLCMGALAALPLASLELAGVISGQSMGLGLARVYNPEADADSDVIGQFLTMIATGVFLTLGGLEQMFAGVLRTFERVPAGAVGLRDTPLDLFLGVLASGTEMALRVALPVAAMTMLMVIVLGVIGKTMPQMNIMSVGFTIKILAGLAALAMGVYAIREAVGEEVSDVLGEVVAWVESLGA